MYTGPAMVVRISIASGEERGPSYVAKRSFVSMTNGSPCWTRRTGGCVALKLVQSWSLVTLFIIETLQEAPACRPGVGYMARRSVAMPPDDVNAPSRQSLSRGMSFGRVLVPEEKSCVPCCPGGVSVWSCAGP